MSDAILYPWTSKSTTPPIPSLELNPKNILLCLAPKITPLDSFHMFVFRFRLCLNSGPGKWINVKVTNQNFEKLRVEVNILNSSSNSGETISVAGYIFFSQASEVHTTQLLSFTSPPPSPSLHTVFWHWIPPEDPDGTRHTALIYLLRRKPHRSTRGNSINIHWWDQHGHISRPPSILQDEHSGGRLNFPNTCRLHVKYTFHINGSNDPKRLRYEDRDNRHGYHW